MIESEGRKFYEDLIMDKLWKLSEAKEEGYDVRFDDILDEVESFLKPFPQVHYEFRMKKNELMKLVNDNFKKIDIEAASMSDEISKDIQISKEKDNVKWDYRTDMLEALIVILVEYQMIPFERPIVGEVGFGELSGEQEQQYEEEGVPSELENDEDFEGTEIAPPEGLEEYMERQERRPPSIKKRSSKLPPKPE